MTFITDIEILAGLNPGESFIKLTKREIKTDDAGAFLGLGPEFIETKPYPITSAWQLSNAS